MKEEEIGKYIVNLEEILEKVAGNKVLEYMKNLDMEKIIEISNINN